MDLGRLDRRVTFQRAVTSRNALNEKVAGGWDEVATVLALREPVRDAERVAGAGVGREVTDRFTTHWSQPLSVLQAGDQLVCDAVAYRIVGIKELGRREGLEFSALARPDLAGRQ